MGNLQQDLKHGRRKKGSSSRDGLHLPASAADAREEWARPHQAVLPGVGQEGVLLDSMRCDDDGRLVCCPDGKGNAHLFWKWHRGPFAGHYAYWFLSRSESWADGFQGLFDKVAECYRGARKPIKDTPRPE